MKILIVSSDRTAAHGGASNIGDAFLTDALAMALESTGAAVEIFDFGGARTTSDISRRSGGVRDLATAIRSNDAVVVGGGTLFQDNEPDRRIGGLSRLCAVVSIMARCLRRPLAFYGVGLDSMARAWPKGVLKIAIAGRPVWLRESESCRRFVAYFGREAHLGADTSLLACEMIARQRAATPQNSSIVVALNRSESAQMSVELIDEWERYGRRTVFLSMEQQEGDSDGDSLSAAVVHRLEYENQVRGWRDALDVIAGSEVVVASRMHALYMAVLAGIPAVAVGGRDKVRAFAEEFGIPRIDSMSDYRTGMEADADGVRLTAAVARASQSLDSLVNVFTG